MRALLIAILISGIFADAQTSSLQWSQANPSGATPSPRIDAPIAYDPVGRQILMFAGQDASGDLNDLWTYAVDRQQWTRLNPGGPSPNPRHGHTVTFDPVRRRIIMIAGQGEKVIAFKKKRRKNTHRKRGHRQHFTTVKGLGITSGKESGGKE